MAFSDFKTIAEVQERFRIRYSENDFIEGEDLNPSAHFLQEFAFTQQHFDVFASEASRCEAIIFPILREIYKGHVDNYALWIKKSIAYDETLSGTPDYFVSTKSELGKTVVGPPLIMLVEAKKHDFEQGWGQCLSELVAAQKINDQRVDTPLAGQLPFTDFPVYGIVTDGIFWQFGRLLGDTFTQNGTNFSLDNLPRLFGAIDFVFKATQQGKL